jgi:hypothetical protein
MVERSDSIMGCSAHGITDAVAQRIIIKIMIMNNRQFDGFCNFESLKIKFLSTAGCQIFILKIPGVASSLAA